MCFRTSQLVHLLFADTEPLSRTATRRPDLFVPSRHFSQQCRPPVEAFKSAPMDPLSWCAPPRVTPSCPTVFPRHTQLRMDMKTSLILARPLATALWPRPSSSALVSWFISLPQEQSLYPGRPRGGLTYSSRLVTFSNRCRPPVEALRVIPRIHSLWCAPPPRHPVVPNLSGYEDFLARPLATALWPRPSSTTPTLGDVQIPL